MAWISATLVALSLVILSRVVVLDAKDTNLEREVISLHWSVSDGALVELPLAATEVRRRDRTRVKMRSCMLNFSGSIVREYYVNGPAG